MDLIDENNKANNTSVSVKRQAWKEAIIAVTRLILAIGRTLAGVLFCVGLVLAIFFDLANGISTPTRTKRYR